MSVLFYFEIFSRMNLKYWYFTHGDRSGVKVGSSMFWFGSDRKCSNLQ